MSTLVAVAVVALSTPAAEGGTLTLANVRATHGVLGPARSDDKVLPGDRYVLSFDIEGITLGPDGVVAYSIGTEVRNAEGRVVHQQEPKAVEAPASLGGSRVPAHARVDVGLDTPPGVYTLKVQVTDRTARTSKQLTRQVEVLPKKFGIVRLSITNDPEGQLPAAAFGAGQSAWLQLGAVGFASPGAGKPPAVTFTVRITDQNGRETREKPMQASSSKDVPVGAALAPVQFLLSLNRPGKFSAEITATDTVSKKTASLTIPLTVTESNN